MAIQGATNDYSYLTATSKSDSTSKAKQTTLGQEQFLKLMTAQMTHQDPTKPMENGQFLTEIAQFGTVSGIQDLQKSFGEFADSINSSQALQATSLVGKYVSAPGTEGLLKSDGSISGDIDLSETTTNVTITITNADTGEVEQTVNLGDYGAGKVPFSWDGTDADGVLSDPGVYTIEATGTVDGTNTALVTDIYSLVDSVSMGGGASGISVNLTGLDSVNFSDIKQIF